MAVSEIVALIYVLSALAGDKERRHSVPSTTVKELRSLLECTFEKPYLETRWVKATYALNLLFNKYGGQENVPDIELQQFLVNLIMLPIGFDTETLVNSHQYEKMVAVLKAVDDGTVFLKKTTITKEERERGPFALELKVIHSIFARYEEHPLHKVVHKDSRPFKKVERRVRKFEEGPYLNLELLQGLTTIASCTPAMDQIIFNARFH